MAIYRGEDEELIFTVLDGTAAVDLDATYTGILCYLYYDNKKVLEKFSKDTLTGFSTLTVTDSANGKFRVKLQSATTINAPVGKLYAEIKVQESNALYDSSSFHSVDADIFVDDVKDSFSKSVTTF